MSALQTAGSPNRYIGTDMNQLLKSALALSALTLAACDSNDSAPPIVEEPATPTLSVQVLHASPDAPKVNVLVNGAVVLEGVDYREGSGRLELDEGTYNVAVEGILPGGNATGALRKSRTAAFMELFASGVQPVAVQPATAFTPSRAPRSALPDAGALR